MNEDAEGVSQDHVQAAKWYRLACEHRFDGGGAGQGCNNLGLLYLDGHGVKRSSVEAFKYFKLSGGEDNPNLETAKSGMSAREVGEAESQVQQWLSRLLKNHGNLNPFLFLVRHEQDSAVCLADLNHGSSAKGPLRMQSSLHDPRVAIQASTERSFF